MFIFGLTLGLIVGVVGTVLIFRRNKAVQAKAEEIADGISDKVHNRET